MALIYYDWSGGSGHAADVWDDAPFFDDDFAYTKFWFAANEAGALFNLSRCMNLVIARCDYLEGLIGAVEPAEITWQAIVNAWIKDDFEGRGVTIAVIDRMRQIIWDEPFYVNWASRPEQAEI